MLIVSRVTVLLTFALGIASLFAEKRPITEKDLFDFVWIGDLQISPDGTRVAFVAAYGYIFEHEFQWMAAKGYVMLYPNPRGSTTYGEDFGNVIQFHYPGDDYKDLMAGVDEVIRRGYIDDKKLGVTGGSGGGLLTNWVVGQTTRFAAAVCQRDIASWEAWW